MTTIDHSPLPAALRHRPPPSAPHRRATASWASRPPHPGSRADAAPRRPAAHRPTAGGSSRPSPTAGPGTSVGSLAGRGAPSVPAGDGRLAQQLRSAASDQAGDDTAVAAALEAALRRAEATGLVDVAYATTPSPIGDLLVAATSTGLVRLAFPTEDDDAVLTELARRIGPRVVASSRRLDAVRRELDEYFEGRRDHFEVALDWRLSSGFRRTVLKHLYADVPYGRTVSYLQLATLVGNPRASRAVGTAMATNPIPIVVPCHRVLRTGGHLGGYGGGLDTKVKLLALESGERPLF